MQKKYLLKEAVILLIAATLILSTMSAIANTTKNPIQITTLQNNISKINTNKQSTSFGDLIWDNGMENDPDGAWSNFDAQYAGANRSLMDDIVVPPGEEWTINELQFYSVWYGEEPGHGTDFVLSFWSDNETGPGPGAPIMTVDTVSYTEEKTGGILFSRNVSLHTYQFTPVVLTEGTYWIEGRTVGMDNNYWFVNNVTNITGQECWLNWEYDDYFGNGTNFIGYPADLIFALYYYEPVEPPEFDISIAGGLGATIDVSNVGGAATNVMANITVEGGLILAGGQTDAELGDIAAGGVATVKILPIGIGKPTITVAVACDEEVSAEATASGFLLLILLLGVS